MLLKLLIELMCISWIKMLIVDLGARCLFKLVMTTKLLVEGAYDTINVHWRCSYDIVNAYATNNAHLGCFCDLKVFILLAVLTKVLMPMAMLIQIV